VNRLGNLVQPMNQTLFPNDTVSQDDNAPIHTAGTLHSCFGEQEGEPQHLPWPAHSPDLNVIEALWSVLMTRVRNRFPPPTSLKQLEDILHEERYKILLETVQNLTTLLKEGQRLYMFQHHINKAMCSVVIILFNPCICHLFHSLQYY
jgi:transposase